jgi:hypothetical protein
MAAVMVMISPELRELLAARAELMLDPAGPAALARVDVFPAPAQSLGRCG